MEVRGKQNPLHHHLPLLSEAEELQALQTAGLLEPGALDDSAGGSSGLSPELSALGCAPECWHWCTPPAKQRDEGHVEEQLERWNEPWYLKPCLSVEMDRMVFSSNP